MSNTELSFYSGYVPVLRLRDDAEAIVREKYYSPLVRKFFSKRDVDSPIELPPEKAIHWKDYQTESRGGVAFDYFYNVLFEGIKRRRGKVAHTMYTLTLDDEMTPQKCERSNVQYGVAKLGRHPFLFYLHIEISEVLNVLREAEVVAEYP